MFKFATAATISVLLLGSTVPASAKMDCDDNYKNFLAKFVNFVGDDGKPTVFPTANIATVHRMAVRAYDTCQAGDEQFASKFFDMIREAGDNARGAEFWEQITKGDDAKRGK